MRKTIALFATLTLATTIFAQEGDGTESAQETPAVVEETPAVAEEPPPVAEEPPAVEEPKKEEKKSAFHVDKRPDPVWGIRLGVHMAGISGESLSFGWHLGGNFYAIKFFDLSLGGDALGLKLFLEPNLLFTTKSGWEGSKQYWLELPVMADLMFTVFSFRFKYNVGPYAAVGLFGDFDKVVTASTISAGKKDADGNYIPSKVGRFDVGLYNTLGYELYKNIWSDFTVGMGFIDMIEGEGGSTNFMIRFTAGLDF